jgi:hypothetical protein
MTSGGGQKAAPPDNDGAAGSQWFLLRFLRLAAPFFTSEERWKAWLITGGLIAPGDQARTAGATEDQGQTAAQGGC